MLYFYLSVLCYAWFWEWSHDQSSPLFFSFLMALIWPWKLVVRICDGTVSKYVHDWRRNSRLRKGKSTAEDVREIIASIKIHEKDFQNKIKIFGPFLKSQGIDIQEFIEKPENSKNDIQGTVSKQESDQPNHVIAKPMSIIEQRWTKEAADRGFNLSESLQYIGGRLDLGDDPLSRQLLELGEIDREPEELPHINQKQETENEKISVEDIPF